MDVGSFIHLSYRSHGVGCMVAFTFVLPLMVGGGFAAFAIAAPDDFLAFAFSTWWAPVCLVAGISAFFYFLGFSLFHWFGETRIIANREALTVRRGLWCFASTTDIQREALQKFEQVKDGGEGEDTFPTWGLFAVAKKKVPVLSRQPLEKSDWLGGVLAEHFGVEYVEASKRE